MDLPEEPLSIVEQWKIKSFQMSAGSNDSIALLLTKGIDTMAVVVNKKSDLNRVEIALASLESERSIALRFDKIKNDDVRSLVYGLIESLHFTLSELTKERNQVKEYGQMSTQTDQELSYPLLVHALPSDQMKDSTEIFTQNDQEPSQPSLEFSSSNDYAERSLYEPIESSLEHPPALNISSVVAYDHSQDEQHIIAPSSFELPKEEIFDESSIKIEDLWGYDLEIKDEEMPNDDADTHKGGDLAEDSGDVASIVHDDRAQSEVPAMNNVGGDFGNEDAHDTMNDSRANEIMGEDNMGSVRAQSAVVALNNLGDEPNFNFNFENEDNDETMNEKNNETIEEDGAKDSSENVGIERRRRSSRIVSRHLRIADGESLGYSNGDSEPMMKKMKTESSKRKNKTTSSGAIKKKGRPLTKGQCRQLKCTECEYLTMSAGSLVEHLRNVHFKTLKLAGLILRCDCGIEVRSGTGVYYTPHCESPNYSVVRQKEGSIRKINDEKTTPQCFLCEAYPKTPAGYVMHLARHHNSLLSAHGIFLLCECGAKYRASHPVSKHTEECTRREYSLHKVADK